MKTDSQLPQDITAELIWEPSIHAPQHVSNVDAPAAELKVQVPAMGERTDADIAGSVNDVLKWTSSLPSGAIKVMVERGWVRLTGDVHWQYQRQVAAESIRFLLGVVGVHNLIVIRPAVSATAVKPEIESTLQRSAITDAKGISVPVEGTDVMLSGTVQDRAERNPTPLATGNRSYLATICLRTA